MPDELIELCGTALFLVTFFAWLTHIVVCMLHGMWLFLIGGAIVIPVGIAHGLYVWFT